METMILLVVLAGAFPSAATPPLALKGLDPIR
jgi:hypothetical protein